MLRSSPSPRRRLATVSATVTLLALVPLASCSSGGDDDGEVVGSLFGVTERGLDRIDPSTGVARAVSGVRMAEREPEGLAFDAATGRVWAIDGEEIFQLDTSMGAVVPMGSVRCSSAFQCLAYDAERDVLWSVDILTDELVRIDATTGVGTLVGATGVGSLVGMAFDTGTQTLYACTSSTLHTIDRDTGAATAVGDFLNATVRGLGFDSNTNTLFGSSTTSGLVTIDTNTGVATVIGGPGTNTFTYDTLADRGLGAEGEPVLLLDVDRVNGAHTPVSVISSELNPLAWDPGTGTIYSADLRDEVLLAIHPGTGVVTFVGPLGAVDVRGLAFDPVADVLWGVSASTDELVRINPTTAATQVIGATGFSALESLAVDTDTDTLYAVDEVTEELVSLDRTTGAGTSIGSTGIADVQSLAYDPSANVLLAGTNAGDLFKIDPSDASSQLIDELRYRFVRGLTLDPDTNTLFGVDTSAFAIFRSPLATLVPTSLLESGMDGEGQGVARGDAGDVFALENGSELLRLDRTTGEGTIVGIIATHNLRGLAFDPSSGTLFGVDPSDDVLVVVDTETAVATEVGPVTPNLFESLAWRPDLGVLYSVDTATDDLYSIDPTTAATTLIGAVGFGDVKALTWDEANGSLIGFDFDSRQLVSIDPSTGSGTALSTPNACFEGLAGPL